MKEAQVRLTDDILKVAQSESIAPDKLRRLIASGRVVLLNNINHDYVPLGIGESL
jgi:thiamine biosynthesis protein ThiC